MIKAEPLTRKAFERYGYILNQAQGNPDAESGEFRFFADIAVFEIEGKIMAGLLEGKKREKMLSCMERHLCTPEILFAMQGEGILCVGEAERDAQDISGIKAFLMKPGDSIMLKKGTWHWVPYPINCEVCLMQVIFKQGTGASDCEIVWLNHPVEIQC